MLFVNLISVNRCRVGIISVYSKLFWLHMGLFLKYYRGFSANCVIAPLLTHTTQNKFCNSYEHIFIFILVNKMKLVYIKRNLSYCSQRHESMVAVCLLKRLLD